MNKTRLLFAEEDIDRYRVRHKYLSKEEMEWQWN